MEDKALDQTINNLKSQVMSFMEKDDIPAAAVNMQMLGWLVELKDLREKYETQQHAIKELQNKEKE